MTQDESYRYTEPKLSITLSEELHKRRCDLIPWGQQSLLIRHLLEKLCDLLEAAGDKKQLAIGAILCNDVTVLDMLKAKAQEKKEV